MSSNIDRKISQLSASLSLLFYWYWAATKYKMFLLTARNSSDRNDPMQIFVFKNYKVEKETWNCSLNASSRVWTIPWQSEEEKNIESLQLT